MSPIETLPAEILAHITTSLTPHETMRLAFTSHELWQALGSPNGEIERQKAIHMSSLGHRLPEYLSYSVFTSGIKTCSHYSLSFELVHALAETEITPKPDLDYLAHQRPRSVPEQENPEQGIRYTPSPLCVLLKYVNNHLFLNLYYILKLPTKDALINLLIANLDFWCCLHSAAYPGEFANRMSALPEE